MNKTDCIKERVSGRTVGLFIFGLSLILGFVGMLLVPVIGFFFAAPIMILGVVFVITPESKACRLVLAKLN